ncbi:mediator complex subunit Med20 [Schizosaccharomyces japonicus yFS275]|uniref:Mediator of RNA polymerase II transcription subunit 20 n=1 Tax=Schizosaccharomyces japonicus (strain yFS275 / FY16936) TaxID=402676 RepID=B6K5X4_SCHJY|nr:mediator complex subunit Med20 [Schizosaccharomyces japonicus yFS275]EEB08928.2 mediator complex subunit Med20 [Schizosaccharomyces japonicus yFS275]
MPVHGLLHCSHVSMATFLAVAQDRLLKQHHAQFLRKWNVHYKLYRNAISPKVLEFLYQNTQPNMMASINNEEAVVDTETDLEAIIVRTKLWTFRQHLCAEGAIYEVGDFVIGVANLLQKTTWKGFLVHVVFKGSDDMSIAQPIIRDLCESCFFRDPTVPVHESYYISEQQYASPKTLQSLFKQRNTMERNSSTTSLHASANVPPMVPAPTAEIPSGSTTDASSAAAAAAAVASNMQQGLHPAAPNSAAAAAYKTEFPMILTNTDSFVDLTNM